MPLDDADHNMLDRRLNAIADCSSSAFCGNEFDVVASAIGELEERLGGELYEIRVALQEVANQLKISNGDQG